MPRMSAPLSPDSPLSPAFSSLPWSELEECGAASRAWCRVERLPHGSYGLALNNCNVLTQKPTNPLCTLKQFDLIVEVNGVPLEGLLCDELNAGDATGGSKGMSKGSIVLTVLRPTVSVDQLLRAAAKLAGRKGISSANPSPNGSRRGLSRCRKQVGSVFGQRPLVQRLLSAPDHASGCSESRPASANQPVGPRWPIKPVLFYRPLVRQPVSKRRAKGCVVRSPVAQQQASRWRFGPRGRHALCARRPPPAASATLEHAPRPSWALPVEPGHITAR